MIERIDQLRGEAEQAIATASTSEALEQLRVRYLGRKAELPQMLRDVATLPPEQRGAVGKTANQARKTLEALIESRGVELSGAELEASLRADAVDVTLPGAPPQPAGRLHVLSSTRRELEDIFLGLGFTVMEAPEVETVHYNFDALNHSPTHPARARTDTFYTAADTVLRTHTSPMQVRAMEAHPPPLYVVIPGRVYRRDLDATHTPQFHQIEGLAVDEDITLADLKGTLLSFARAVFGDQRDVRLRPHFFPFTEPSVEIDVSCFHCSGKGFMGDGSRCYLCKGEGWLEILGAGEVDPNVYAHVPTTEANAPGYDPEKVQGFAWGLGVERIAMLKHGIPDLRLYYENDLRFLEQFVRVPLSWLREYCDPDLDVKQIEERLTMTGTKVEAIHRQGVRSTEGFVVGRVLSAEQHPDADRLKVCKVDLGGDEPATIVCGAPNVTGGQTVAVAKPGAVMPDGTKLKQAKLRGVVSEGMILAENELEVGPGGEGIMVLDQMTPDAEWAAGTPLAEVLPISTEVIELEITPNRPDCLGVYGVARELHAATGATLAPAPWGEDPGSTGEVTGAKIRVECPDLCPRFTARLFEHVTIAPSPPWLKARLMAAGQRPINNVVDITNYAMLLSGQPLHAFDLDRVAGGELTVRRAREGEQIETLDGQTRTLDGEMLLIEDAEGPTSIAGLMGGARSEVQPHTTRVLLEVATWNGPNIHSSSWKLGLRSEASGRFEKGLQPEQCMHAQALASRLMLELCGATLVPGTIDIGAPSPHAASIRLREARVEAILGVSVSRARQQEILTALDFGTQQTEDGLDVAVPALRRDDVTREVDLIEEVARIDGLECLPATLPARRGAAGKLTHAQRVRRAAEDVMVGRGLHEIVGWSFTEPGLLDRLRIPADHAMRRVVTVENPLSADQSIMRPTLLGSLLDAARHNVARNGADVAIFESGTVYRAQDADAAPSPGGFAADEHHGLGAVLSGGLTPRSWRGERGEADFFAAKALLSALLDRFGVHWSVRPTGAEQWPFLHPGRSAAVLARDLDSKPLTLGFLGELHPLVAAAWDLERTAAFAVDVGKLAAVAPEVATFKPFGAFPVLRQDLAVTLPVAVSARELTHLVRKAAGEMLDKAEIFDVYTGSQVGEGRRSLALALSFRSLERTLTDEDVAPVRVAIVEALGELGGELRG